MSHFEKFIELKAKMVEIYPSFEKQITTGANDLFSIFYHTEMNAEKPFSVWGRAATMVTNDLLFYGQPPAVEEKINAFVALAQILGFEQKFYEYFIMITRFAALHAYSDETDKILKEIDRKTESVPLSFTKENQPALSAKLNNRMDIIKEYAKPLDTSKVRKPRYNPNRRVK